MPAYWWLYNMYALARNSWKFKNRDKRKNKIQNIEFDALAPDTIEEIINARKLIEIWTAKARLIQQGKPVNKSDENDLIQLGKELLSTNEVIVNKLEICGENMEKSNRKIVIIKTHRAYHAYFDMLLYYAVKNLLEYYESDNKINLSTMNASLNSSRNTDWTNLGGQLIPARDIDRLRADVGKLKLKNWDAIHKRYDELWIKYPLEKQNHAYAVLCLSLIHI